MKKYTYDEIKVLLAGNDRVTVEFVKANAEARIMQCTIKESLIPGGFLPKSEKIVKPNADTIRVFDTEKNGWRSFRVDSVTNVTPV